MIRLIIYSCLSLLLLSACSEETNNNLQNNSNTTDLLIDKSEAIDSIANQSNTETSKHINYPLLQQKVIRGSASLFEVKQALTDTDVGSLTNTVHGLYSMRWHRGVYNLLNDMWEQKQEAHPDFAWDSLNKVPVRIALASTINRIKIVNTDEQLQYIHDHKYDDHEFHRAQAVVALGINGKPEDIEYIKSMALADNHYVAQSAMTGLALMNNEKAKFALAEIWKENQGTKKGDLAEKIIQKVFNETPKLKAAESDTETEKNEE
jgi:HEAT repeat protein